MALKGIDMNVGSPALDGLMDQTIDQTDNRGIILPLQQISRLRNIIDQAFQPSPAFHRCIDIPVRHGALRESLCQSAVICFLIQGLEYKDCAQSSPCLHQAEGICPLPDPDSQRVPFRQDDQALLFGEGICELGRGGAIHHCGGGLPNT